MTGSSGKGSTVSMVAHILEGAGKKVVFNASGSNVLTAIVTLVLSNTKAFSHEVDADVLLLEMDERYIAGTFRPGVITHMAVTNITRDQPARNAHPEVILKKIMESLDDGMHLILNADDPIAMRMTFGHFGRQSTYGVAKVEGETGERPEYAIDAAYCPSCRGKLEYEAYHYGHLGVYNCPRCSFGRGSVKYEATEVDIKKGSFVVQGNRLVLDKKVFFAVYYTLLSYAICDILGIDKETIVHEIDEDRKEAKRGKSYILAGRRIEMLESKNENSLSYLQSIDYIRNQDGKKTIILGFENVSRRYKHNDLSWLYDVPFERLNDESVDKIFVIGRFRNDVALRLEYAGFDDDKLFLVEDMDKLLEDVVSHSAGNIYTMVCFDMTAIIKEKLEEREHEKED